MEEQERIEAEDVEGHRRKAQFQAAEDVADESEEDDVEAHMLRFRPDSG